MAEVAVHRGPEAIIDQDVLRVDAVAASDRISKMSNASLLEYFRSLKERFGTWSSGTCSTRTAATC
jgi:hypothetical protein